MITDLALTSLACAASAYVLYETEAKHHAVASFYDALTVALLIFAVLAALLAVVLPFTAIFIPSPR
jgi:hypothetical protein